MNQPWSNRIQSFRTTISSSKRETGKFWNINTDFASITQSDHKSTCGSSPILSPKFTKQSPLSNLKPKASLSSSSEEDCETLVKRLGNTILDRLETDNKNNQRKATDLNQSITSLSTQISMARNEMKSIKGSSLSIFDSLEKTKQANNTLHKESDFLQKELESTNDEVNSLANKLRKIEQENQQIKKDIDKEAYELCALKQSERQTANDNNEMIQMKRILTTSIVLARKEISRIMNNVNGLVSKRATVRDELDVLIKTYDY